MPHTQARAPLAATARYVGVAAHGAPRVETRAARGPGADAGASGPVLDFTAEGSLEARGRFVAYQDVAARRALLARRALGSKTLAPLRTALSAQTPKKNPTAHLGGLGYKLRVRSCEDARCSPHFTPEPKAQSARTSVVDVARARPPSARGLARNGRERRYARAHPTHTAQARPLRDPQESLAHVARARRARDEATHPHSTSPSRLDAPLVQDTHTHKAVSKVCARKFESRRLLRRALYSIFTF